MLNAKNVTAQELATVLPAMKEIHTTAQGVVVENVKAMMNALINWLVLDTSALIHVSAFVALTPSAM